MTQFDVKTHAKDELIDITASVQNIATNSQVKNGVCFIYVPHTTAGVTINENADPSVQSDIIMALRHIVHVKATLVGCSASVLINNGSLSLGTWQGIFFCEFDGPRNRKVFVKIIPG